MGCFISLFSFVAIFFLGLKIYLRGFDSLSVNESVGIISAVIFFLLGLYMTGQKETDKEANKQKAFNKYKEINGSHINTLFEVNATHVGACFSSKKDFVCIFSFDGYDVIPFENFTQIKMISEGQKVRFIFTNSKYKYLDVTPFGSLQDKYDYYLSNLGW